MNFSHAYLLTNNTDEGVVKQARLVYDTAGGQAARSFPEGKRAPENAVSAQWDSETLTMTYTLENGETEAVELTEQEIEDAKETEAL